MISRLLKELVAEAKEVARGIPAWLEEKAEDIANRARYKPCDRCGSYVDPELLAGLKDGSLLCPRCTVEEEVRRRERN